MIDSGIPHFKKALQVLSDVWLANAATLLKRAESMMGASGLALEPTA